MILTSLANSRDGRWEANHNLLKGGSWLLSCLQSESELGDDFERLASVVGLQWYIF
jgi:hypothetical protein